MSKDIYLFLIICREKKRKMNRMKCKCNIRKMNRAIINNYCKAVLNIKKED